MLFGYPSQIIELRFLVWPDYVGLEENIELLLRVTVADVSEQAADNGHVAQDGDFRVALALIELDQTAQDNGIIIRHEDRRGDLAAGLIRRRAR